jgi:hypothetical protein
MEEKRVYTYTVASGLTDTRGTIPMQPITTGMGTGFTSATGMGTGFTGTTEVGGTLPPTPREAVNVLSPIHPTEVAAGAVVHPTEHMVSTLRPSETMSGLGYMTSAEGLVSPVTPPSELMSSLRLQTQEPMVRTTEIIQERPISEKFVRVEAPTVIREYSSHLATEGKLMHPVETRQVPLVPVVENIRPETRQLPITTETFIETRPMETMRPLETTRPLETISHVETIKTVEPMKPIVETTRSLETRPLETLRPIDTTVGSMTHAEVIPPVGTHTMGTTMGSTAMGTTAHHEVHEEEKKGGFFSHMFHHHGAATHPKEVHDDLADRFIHQFEKSPRELSYYEQFVVQYNRGMRLTPTQARRLVEVLLKNSRAGRTVNYYSVYALELLLKLAIADPIVHAELERIDDTALSGLRLDKYILNDETKPLGLSFLWYLNRYLGRTRFEQFVVSKKAERDTMLHGNIRDYLATQQDLTINSFLESISRRLPPLLPHAPIGAHLITQRPVLIEKQLVTERPVIVTETVTHTVGAPSGLIAIPTTGSSTIYKV